MSAPDAIAMIRADVNRQGGPVFARMLLARIDELEAQIRGRAAVTEASTRVAWDAYCEYLERAEQHNPDSRTLTAPEFLWRWFVTVRNPERA